MRQSIRDAVEEAFDLHPSGDRIHGPSGLHAIARLFRQDVFCAGLVTNTAGIQDYGLNQHTWEGLEQARKDKTIDHISYIEFH